MAGSIERTIEKGPLSSHSLQTDPTLTARHSNPLKVSVAYHSPAPRRMRPNGPCQLNIHFSLPRVSPFTIAGHNRGISQKEMPEVWRRCLCSLSPPHYIWHCPGCYHSYVMECRVLITGCQKKSLCLVTAQFINYVCDRVYNWWFSSTIMWEELNYLS